MRETTCQRCGKPFTTEAHNTQFCPVCRIKNKADRDAARYRGTGTREHQDACYRIVYDPDGTFHPGAMLSVISADLTIGAGYMLSGMILERRGRRYIVRGTKLEGLRD